MHSHLPLPSLCVIFFLLTPITLCQPTSPSPSIAAPSLSAVSTPLTRCVSQAALVCILRPTTSQRARGRVIFSPVYANNQCEVLVSARVVNLTPGAHGFHIHTYGDVSRRDATSAGGHFANPAGSPRKHGFQKSAERHWGDLGNLNAAGNGVATYVAVDKVIGLKGILGRSMVVHEGPDLGPTAQPSGGAGSRIASCVIGIANPDLL